MAVNEYVRGASVVVFVTFRDADSTDADPGDVNLTITGPDGVELAYAKADLASNATGEFELTLVADQVGDWHYRWEGSGAFVAASEGVFTVWSSY